MGSIAVTDGIGRTTNGHMNDGQKHSQLTLSQWTLLKDLLEERDGRPGNVQVKGSGLKIPHVIAVSKYKMQAVVDTGPTIATTVGKSVELLTDELAAGKSIYGITTGFGGSADTQTNNVDALQTTLCQFLQAGILPSVPQDHLHGSDDIFQSSYSHSEMLSTLSMPESWVRSAMLIRSNSLVRGHSGVRLFLIESLLLLLSQNCIPLVPLRGSISASGDLQPLSYVAGLLEGNPDILVWTGSPSKRILVPANEVLAQHSISPVKFNAKEGLGITNGTSVSVGVAALALFDANNLVVLTQVLTAMCTEALLGTADNFHPFIAEVRPHEGQIEVARNITSFLLGSRLAREEQEGEDGLSDGLRQDRYALRTSSQWLSPVLEDFLLAHKQLETELNSTTDNPLLDTSTRQIHHGGNFQATAVTSSTEKTRLGLQLIGKLIFAQSTELLDVKLNNGLPPNLAADEPSLSYTCKGVDISMAAYMAELAFVASPVSSHVQAAEMGNQAVNSMALVSARYTHTAVDLLSLMCAAHLYSLCQALDLRVMHAKFLVLLEPEMERVNREVFGDVMSIDTLIDLNQSLWAVAIKGLYSTRTEDSSDRFEIIAQSAIPTIFKALEQIYHKEVGVSQLGLENGYSKPDNPFLLLRSWTDKFAQLSKTLWIENREMYFLKPDASAYLGVASKRMYLFVRKELGVPFHRGLSEHPIAGANDGKKTIGSWISVIHQALRSGKLMEPVMACVGEALQRG